MLPPHINVALVEDEPDTHARLCAALALDDTIELVHTTSAGLPMLHWLAQKVSQQPSSPMPHVLLVDLGLPDVHGLEVIRRAKLLHPEMEVMVITMFGDEANMIQAFEAGASGYLLKDGNEDELAEHVKTLHAGGSPMSPLIARKLLVRMGQSPKALPSYALPSNALQPMPVREAGASRLLTDREETVLQHLARGYTYGELAKKMGITINTVQTHIRGLYAKLEVHSKSQALREAKQLGLLAD